MDVNTQTCRYTRTHSHINTDTDIGAYTHTHTHELTHINTYTDIGAYTLMISYMRYLPYQYDASIHIVHDTHD